MAVSLSKKRPATRAAAKELIQTRSSSCLFSSVFFTVLYRIPTAALLLALIFLWSSSTTLISGNIVHVCVSSRKLNNLYCLSAGAQSQPSFNLPIPIFSGPDNSTTMTSIDGGNGSAGEREDVKMSSFPTTTDLSEVVQGSIVGQNSADEREKAIVEVKGQLDVQRSWISHSSNELKCDGRGIFVYDLPSKFNKDLMDRCGDVVPWMNNFCKYLQNDAMGEPALELGTRWFRTHQYALEPIFHSRVLKHPCRVYNHSDAKLFYVPYYGGLDVLRWHFKSNVSDKAKDSLSSELIDWLSHQATWRKKQGKDHAFVLGKITWDFRRNDINTWGNTFLEHDQMQNPIKLLIERQPWHVNDVGIPHPTGFHPRSDDDVMAWQRKIISSWRRNMVSFVGAARPDSPDNIRSVLIHQCNSEQTGACFFLDCRSGGCDQPEKVTSTFMESEFCLQPPGDSPTRKSFFDSLVSGCIPVVFDPFTAYYQYAWHLPEDVTKFSVFIDEDEVREKKVDVLERLRKISKEEKEDMRSFIVYELMPGLVYGDSSAEFKIFQDAFSITMNNLVERARKL